MRRYLTTLTALLIGSWSIAQDVVHNQYRFEVLAELPCTDVKDQAKTGTCWSFSTNSLIESELMRQGLEVVDLSEMFYVRHIFVDKARKYVRYHGKTNFSDGSLCHDVLFGLREFGAVPEEVYGGRPKGEKEHNHQALNRELKEYLDTTIAKRTIPGDWEAGFTAILDKHLGTLPDSFEYAGNYYTARSFADSWIRVDPGAYINFTSFNHHPLYQSFILEIPDNYANGSYYNVSLEELFEITRAAVLEGYSVAWDCDVSEKGFSSRQGLALVPDLPEQEPGAATPAMDPFVGPCPEKEITSEMRQNEFDTYSLTDDHLMHIVGIVKDQNGKEYFQVKNSWGTEAGRDGFLFASKAYFLANTIAVTLHKDAVPEVIMTKIHNWSIR